MTDQHAVARWSELGIRAWDAGRVTQAIDHFRRAVASDPGQPRSHINLAQVLLLNGDLEAGFRELEWLWPYRPGELRWDGRRLNGETVLLHSGGQGFGDWIQFCRFAPLLADRGARVVCHVPPALERLISTVPGVTEAFSAARWRLPLRYYSCPVMALPARFGTTLMTIPAAVTYLKADPAPWQAVLGDLPGLKIGLCWAGQARTNQPNAVEMDRRRSMRLIDLVPLLNVSGCSFVSLQLGPAADQLRAFPAVRDISHRLADWQDTADLVAGLDLIVSADTAVAHLAGALGKPTWLLNRFSTCWRWLRNRDDSPWYPTMRIFRQQIPGQWGGVVEAAQSALEKAARDQEIFGDVASHTSRRNPGQVYLTNA